MSNENEEVLGGPGVADAQASYAEGVHDVPGARMVGKQRSSDTGVDAAGGDGWTSDTVAAAPSTEAGDTGATSHPMDDSRKYSFWTIQCDDPFVCTLELEYNVTTANEYTASSNRYDFQNGTWVKKTNDKKEKIVTLTENGGNKFVVLVTDPNDYFVRDQRGEGVIGDKSTEGWVKFLYRCIRVRKGWYD